MRKKALAALAHGMRSAALGGVFVGALVGGVFIHANVPPLRRLAVSVANDALSTLFQGRLVIGALDELSLGATGHVRVAQAEITDPEGRRVIFAKGIDARIDLARLVGSILSGKTPEVIIDSASVNDAEVIVDFDAKGELGIARAFLPRPTTKPKPTPTKPNAAVAEAVRLSIAKAYVHHAWVHGNVVPPHLDADSDEIRAHVFIFDNRLTVKVDDARTTMRSPRIPGQQGDVHGAGTGELSVPLAASRRDIVMHWELIGDGAGIPLVAHLAMEQDRIIMAMDIAPVAPEVVRGAFPMVPLSRPVELHAKAEGELTKPLTLKANGRVGDATFVADGQLGLGENQPFVVDAELTRVDGAAFSGPTSDVSGHVHAEGTIAQGAPAGTFRVETKEGAVQGQLAPAVTAEGRFDGKRIDASFRAHERGADADGEITVRIPEAKLDFDVRARSKNLREVAQAPNVVGGAGSAHATGTINLAQRTVQAHVTADGTGVAKEPASADGLHAEATVSGPLDNPVIDVTASAKQLRFTARGADPAKTQPLTYPSATGRARIVLSPTPRLLDVVAHVDASENGTSIDASATEIDLGGRSGGVDVHGGKIRGLGAPLDADVRVQDGAVSVHARGSGLDMQKVAAMTGIKELRLLPEGSRADIDVAIDATARRTDGQVDVSIAGAKDGTSAEIHATLAGRHVHGRARVAVGTVGFVEVQAAELELPGGLSAATLRRATGAVDLRGEIDLSQGAALFAGENIERISGTALLAARIERGDPRNLPTVYASAHTRDLDVTFNRDGVSTHVGGVDLGVNLGYDGATDQTEASLLTWDAKGILATADVKSQVPIVAWITGAKPWSRDALAALEINGVVDVPRRDVAALPAALAQADLLGTVEAHADIAGSIAKPRVALVARADGISERRQTLRRQSGPSADPLGGGYSPFDGRVEARWDGNDVVAALVIDERPDVPVVTKTGAVLDRTEGHLRGLVIARAPMSDLLAGRPLAWDASAELDITDLELAPLPLPHDVRGTLTGRLKVRDLGTAPQLEANAQVDGLTIDGARIAFSELKAEGKNGSLVARARINQDDGGSGSVKVVSSSLVWHGFDVAWNEAQPTRLEYTFERFRISVFRPLVARVMPEIDGRVDGRGSATVDAKEQVFEGGLTLRGGRIYLNAIGEEITAIAGTATFERGGAFRIQDASGKIGSGELKASAAGRMSGLHFESGEAVVIVPSKEGVPLSAEGATYAQATGEVNLTAKLDHATKTFVVTVGVPRAKVTIPNRSTQKLQSLDPDETIAVGIRKPDGVLAPPVLRPGQAKRAAAKGDADPEAVIARFTVSLGNEVQLEGRGVKLGLGGKTIVEIADEVAVTGQISLKNGGTIDVQGRKFIVDRGTVSFVEPEQPANPIVIAAAYWDAPDRTRVWVEFDGPLKTGKLTLRSEPPYSKNEILSILLFGRADPNAAPSGERPSDAQQATAVGTGIASSGLNKALGELDEDFDLEQDRTSANRVRTKVGYRLRRNLKIQLGYAAGFSLREPDTTYVFLEWQFIPQWLLIGTYGDRGTSILDVLFQHRY